MSSGDNESSTKFFGQFAEIAKNGSAVVAFFTALVTAIFVIVTAYLTYGSKVDHLTKKVAALEEKVAVLAKAEPRDLILEKCIELAAQRTETLANEGSIERAMIDLNCPARTIGSKK